MDWWSGAQLGDRQLWGLRLPLWSRIGKVLQFAAGLTVVLDLVGPDALRAFGRRLATVPWRRGFTRTAEVAAVVVLGASFLAWVAFVMIGIASDYFAPAAHFISALDLSDTWAGTWWGSYLIIGIMVAVAVPMFAVLNGVDDARSVGRLGTDRPKSRLRAKGNARMALGLVPVVVIAAVALAAVLLPWLVFIYGICMPASRGMAALLDRGRPGHPLRWVALLLVVVGFHFDLLAT